MEEFLVIGLVIAGALGFGIYKLMAGHKVFVARGKYIEKYAFPAELRNKLQREPLGLTLEQSGQVIEGLRQYFMACLSARRMRSKVRLGMPSKAVDAAWHEFILMTRDYEKFCTQAFGAMLHHTPGTEERSQAQDRAETAHTLFHMKRAAPNGAAWAMLGTMPLLFALDRELGVKDGHVYDDAAFLSLDRFTAASTAGGGTTFTSGTSSDSEPWSDSSSSSSDSGGSSCSSGSSCGGGGGGDS